MTCSHPKESRSLLAGYDVVCGECEKIVGRVALFPCAVLSRREAEALLAEPVREGVHFRDARAKLQQAVRA